MLSGRAAADPVGPPAHRVGAYVEKYGWGFERLGVTPEQFSARYSVPIRVSLTRLRGH